MPNRYTRESAIESEAVNSLAWQAEVFWRRLLNRVDDFGRFSGNPKLLRASLFPLQMDRVSEMDVARMLLECERAGLLFVYAIQGKPFLALNKWELGRATTSKHPAPPPEVEAKIERFDPVGSGAHVGTRYGGMAVGIGCFAPPVPKLGTAVPKVDTHALGTDSDSDSDSDSEVLSTREGKPASQPAEPPGPRPAPPSTGSTWADVETFANGPAGIPKAVAEAFWQSMEACGWIDAQHRPVLRWQPALTRFASSWRANDEKTRGMGGNLNGGPNAARRGPFLSELTAQQKAVEAELQQIRNRGHEDAFGLHVRPEDKPRYKDLRKRKQDLQTQIADFGKDVAA